MRGFRPLDVRIVRWPFKVLYAAGAWIVVTVLGRGLALSGLAPQGVDVAVAALQLVAVFYGARVFRGRAELCDPPRAAWRMSSRPPASRWLGVLFAVAVGIDVAYLVLVGVDGAVGYTVRPVSEPVFGYLVALVEYLVLAIAFQNSGIRLTARMPPDARPRTS